MLVLIQYLSFAFLKLPSIYTIIVNILLFIIFCIITLSTGSYPSILSFLSVIGCIGVSLIIFSLYSYNYEYQFRISFLQSTKIELAEQNCTRLLQNMLPSSIIYQLKTGQLLRFQKFNDVSILFCNKH